VALDINNRSKQEIFCRRSAPGIFLQIDMITLKKAILAIMNKQIAASTKIINIINQKKKLPPYREALIAFLETNLKTPKGKILDLGSGQWTWTKDRLAQCHDCELTSFDKAKAINVDVVGDLIELDKFFKSNTFDMVICTDVIEHVNQPFKAICRINDVLKPGGIFLASCPFDKELHGEDYGDYWRITRQGWKELLKDTFTEISIEWLGEELKPKAYFIKAIKK
jgi:SAM-dependent methyltransferase